MDLGMFYDAIKLVTQLSDELPVSINGKSYYPKSYYNREWCRFLHSHLGKPTKDFSIMQGLSKEFTSNWVMDKSFYIKNYTEQPGLEPHISDVKLTPWQNLPASKQTLLCEGHRIGSAIYKQGTKLSSSPNIHSERLAIISGMASLEIGQVMSEYWNSPPSLKNKDKITWRRPFEIAMKWMRFLETSNPLFWNSEVGVLSPGWTTSINIISQNLTSHRYEAHLPSYYKVFIDNLKVDSEMRKVKVNSSNSVEKFYALHQYLSTNSAADNPISRDNTGEDGNKDDVIVIRHYLKSQKSGGEKLIKGVKYVLKSNRERKLDLEMKMIHDELTVQSYLAELEYIWRKIEEERKKLTETPTSASVNSIDPIINLTISLMFYFFNLIPTSSAGPEVAYSTMVGLFLGLGRETAGEVPRGKELFMEALANNEPDKFRLVVRSWLKLVKYSRSLHNLVMPNSVKVAEVFATFRDIMEALLYDLTSLCNK